MLEHIGDLAHIIEGAVMEVDRQDCSNPFILGLNAYGGQIDQYNDAIGRSVKKTSSAGSITTLETQQGLRFLIDPLLHAMPEVLEPEHLLTLGAYTNSHFVHDASRSNFGSLFAVVHCGQNLPSATQRAFYKAFWPADFLRKDQEMEDTRASLKEKMTQKDYLAIKDRREEFKKAIGQLDNVRRQIIYPGSILNDWDYGRLSSRKWRGEALTQDQQDVLDYEEQIRIQSAVLSDEDQWFLEGLKKTLEPFLDVPLMVVDIDYLVSAEIAPSK